MENGKWKNNNKKICNNVYHILYRSLLIHAFRTLSIFFSLSRHFTLLDARNEKNRLKIKRRVKKSWYASSHIYCNSCKPIASNIASLYNRMPWLFYYMVNVVMLACCAERIIRQREKRKNEKKKKLIKNNELMFHACSFLALANKIIQSLTHSLTTVWCTYLQSLFWILLCYFVSFLFCKAHFNEHNGTMAQIISPHISKLIYLCWKICSLHVCTFCCWFISFCFFLICYEHEYRAIEINFAPVCNNV